MANQYNPNQNTRQNQDQRGTQSTVSKNPNQKSSAGKDQKDKKSGKDNCGC